MLNNYSIILLDKQAWENINSFYLFIWPREILVPWPGIEPGPLALKAWSPNQWTTREFPINSFGCLLLWAKQASYQQGIKHRSGHTGK